MKHTPVRPRAALFIGAALLATPAFAQDAQTVAPPPVVSTVPAPAPAPAAAPTVTFAPAAPTVQAVPAAPVAVAPRAATPRATVRTTATRQTSRTTTQTSAPAAEPAVPAPAPVAQPEPTAVTPPVAAEPAAPLQTETATTTTTETPPTQRALWPWLLGGALLVIGALAAFLMRRRRTEYDEVYEETYEAPLAAEPSYTPRHEPEVAPRVAAPIAADVAMEPVTIEDDAAIAKPNAEDLAGVTDHSAPVNHRPWLEFGMRPVRAGTSADEGVVEIELTVGNSGDEIARDVRISTFLLPAGSSSGMEQLLIDRPADSTVPPVSIKPGEGTRVDATLAMLKSELQAQGDSFSPVVVADARYTMADGTEGRTSATFRVGLWNDGDGIEPIDLGRPQMHDNVAAELHGTPAHA